MATTHLKPEKKIERELLWIIGFFAFLVLLFVGARAFFTELKQVEYEGLVFTKEKFGELEVYHYSYSFRAPGGKIINYNLFVRTNPAENSVPVDGTIYFKGPKVYVGINASDLSQCNKSVIAAGTLSQFLGDNQFQVKGGVMDPLEAADLNVSHITCERYQGQNVIEMFIGEKTEITSDDGCVKISISPECNILEAVEKFEVQTVIDSQKIHSQLSTS